MKMNKLLGGIALAATFATGMTAFGAGGDIFEIRPCTADGTATDAYSTLESPMSVGERAYFNVRLIQRTAGDDNTVWRLVHVGATSEIVDDALYPLQIGIYVSGRLTYATLEECKADSANGFTDLIFSYLTKVGDFATPILLATETGPASDADTADLAYKLNRTDKWRVRNANGDDAKMWFWTPNRPASSPDGGGRKLDYSLSQCGFFIRSIDFASNWETPKTDALPLWRSVHQNSTQTIGTPVALDASAAVEEAITLYVWSDDESAVKIKNGTPMNLVTGYDSGNNPIIKQTQVAEVVFERGRVTSGFSIEGVAENGTANLVLSAWPNYNYSAATGVRITDYITVPVKCIEPLPASVVVESDTLTAVADGDYLVSKARLSVYLTQAVSVPVTVTVTPAFEDGHTEPWGNYVRFSPTQDTVQTLPGGSTLPTVTIPAGSTAKYPLYVYTLRGDAHTIGDGHQVQFNPTISAEDSAASGIDMASMVSGAMWISAAKPVITSPTTSGTYEVTSGEDLEINVAVDDTYADMTDTATGYKVEIKTGPTASWVELTERFSASGEDGALIGLTSGKPPTMTYNGSGDYASQVRVTSPVSGKRSEIAYFNVHVAAARTTTCETTDDKDDTYEEGDTVRFKVSLSAPNDTPTTVYAFLLALDDVDLGMFGGNPCILTNDAVAAPATTGRPISVNGTSATGNFTVLDGSEDGQNYTFSVVLCTKKNYDPAYKLSGYPTTEMINIMVYNKAPTINTVYVNGFESETDGYTFQNQYPKGQNITIKTDIDDAAYDLTHGFQYKWTAIRNGTPRENKTVGHKADSDTLVAEGTSINDASFTYNFPQSGTWTVKIQALDKDLIDAGTSWSKAPVYSFNLNIIDSPTLMVEEKVISETDNRARIGLGIGFYEVEDASPIVVKVTVTPPDGTNPGKLTLANEYKTIPAGYETMFPTGLAANEYLVSFTDANDQELVIDDLDGTRLSSSKGFTVRAEVITPTQSIDPTKTWAQYYNPFSAKVYIENIAPVLGNVTESQTNAWNVGGGMATDYPITWEVQGDVDADFTTLWADNSGPGVRVKFTGCENPESERVRYVTTPFFGTFVPNFGSRQGLQTVVLTIEDKDGGSHRFEYKYFVRASKFLTTIAHGPSSGTASSRLSVKYNNAGGLGEGHTWVEGGIFAGASSFRLKWNCSRASSINAWAWGYKTSDPVDDGDLDGTARYQHDIPLDPRGNNITAGNVELASYYNYSDAAKDSYLYVWLLHTVGENGGVTSQIHGSISPEMAEASAAPSNVPLPTEPVDEEDGSFAETYVEAIFSREYLATDNCGDINADGIPDRMVVRYGFGIFNTEDEEGEQSGNDLQDIASFNEDADYLPSRSFEGGMPSSADGWTTLGVPFDANWEIRGFHEGLNLRKDPDGKNSYVRGKWISVPHFSEAETNAVAKWNGVQTWADFKATVPTDDPDYATKLATWQADFNTALNKDDSWIPEKRTDPTMWDTDGDFLPDGYEYYFWYRAAVGWMDGDKWVQLTGEKFTLNNITKGEPLSAEDIMKAFDPTVRATGANIAARDTDNDGLSDLEEFAMGTNPVHWDSDGDGMSDLWEVMRGMNPLKAPTNPEMNADGDFMASYHTQGSYAIVTLNNGKIYALEQNGTNLKTFNVDSFDGDGGKTKGGTNVLASVVFGEVDVSNVTALAVFHYGNDSAVCVPKKRGTPNGQVKPLDPDVVKLADTEVVSVQLRQSLMLIHDQVYNQLEFHPFTGWFVNRNGDVSHRWGPAVNTVPYNCVDEYRLMKYRYETGIATPNNNRPLPDLFRDLTTNPNRPFSEAAYTVSWAGTDGGGSEQVGSVAEIPTYTSDNHGADTDEDGIPDGWELYVGANPNDADDAAGDGDRDGLSLLNEYAGSDSCNAYESATNGNNVATIYQHHPGNARGWFNKFTPTDPNASDTDSDGLSDGAEGNAFIFGDPTDDGSKCIRGGGLNPCGVDTDFDLLPDLWERQYQGTVVPAGTGFEGIHPDIVQIIKRNDNLGTNAVIRAYISYGMDGTYNDAFKVPTANQVDPRTGTRRNLDFDNDGLQNFQEYLVQVLRHLRYDDTETPLMGSYLPNGIAGTRKYIGFLPMQVWDGSTFFKTARAAGFAGLSSRQGDGFKYRELGYFAPPEKTWDLTMSGSRLLMPPRGLSDTATADDEARLGNSRYVGTDPRAWDTDSDGMDDYYELFHGLNPLLGGKDVISEAYNTTLSNKKLFSARCTAWSNWQETELVYDAMRFPWAMGVAEADADGDGLRNTDEALLVNMPNPKNYHTDPTPLWMTDSSSKISVTAQYYCRDPYASGEGEDVPALSTYPWFTYVDGKDPGGVNKFMFTFEENEGYDTDHDWIPDEQELTHAVTSATSPIHGSDPDRRQAMYFPGEESVLQSYSGKLHRRIGENYAMLRSFSVEAWVRPEDLSRDQTIVTRVCNYPSSTLSNATHQVRANFRIKMEAGGRVWGEFDSDDAVPNGSPKGFGTTTVEGNTLESNKWSHVALTFDGNELILYINGRDIHRSKSNLIPANGLIVTLQDVNPNGANFGVDGYDTYPSALLIGADAKELGALDIGSESSWTNYCAHYKGWVDEVRVWDGARTQAEIQADMAKRYTLQDVSDLRNAVYKEWLKDGTHNLNDGHPNLPTELVFHYGFQQLPSEVSADYVTSEPSGFTERVLDNVKWNGRSVDIRCGWWNAIPIASTVYGNRAIVPWIRDTCAMLPALDGSTYDSRYWSELIGGVTLPADVNVSKFIFPNMANPYPYWNYMAETFFREQRLDWMRNSIDDDNLKIAVRDVYNRLRFGNRTLFVGGSDLLPLGGAYVKRCPDFWDDNGSTDAWTATADDTDNDGLPDWWEAWAEAKYGADAATLTARTKVNYSLPSGAVVEMSAWEAYQIDLARGIMPGVYAETDDPYDMAYESMADNNNDGLPDWWQKLYDIYDLDPDEDPDNDGLSIYQEWLISWGEDFGFGVLNGYPFLNPTKTRSGDAQEVTDYFLKSTTAPYEGYYLGEIVADFDMMEDGFEDVFGTDDMLFDAWSDYDEDGWSAWSELRYSTFKKSKSGKFVSHYVGDTEVADSPEPVIHVTLRYNGEIPADSTNTTFIVQAYSGNNMLNAPAATYKYTLGETEQHDYFLGAPEKRVIHGTFTPGHVQPQGGSFVLERAYIQSTDSYSWSVVVNGVTNHFTGTYEELDAARITYNDSFQVDLPTFSWAAAPTQLQVDVDDATQKGFMYVGMVRAGEIDFTSGDFTLDLAKVADGNLAATTTGSPDNYVYRLRYTTKLPKMQGRKMSLSLGKPDSGALVEGSTAFESFIDLDGNGAFTPGVEPFGFVKNVEVGWDNVPDLVIEMTDTSAAAGERFAYPASTNAVRIIRTAINGLEMLDNATPVKRRIVYNRDAVTSKRRSVHEGDLVTAGKFGLDWANLRTDVEAMAGLDPKSVLSVTYTVVTNAGSVININSNDVLRTFTVNFPAEQTKPSAVSPSPQTGPKVETQRPTFRWTGTEDNTAFILQILDTDENPVYTSDLQVLPPRDATGAYVWTAPAYIGTNVCADAWSLDNNTNYSWRVAMFSPKFSNTNLETAVWSDAAAFSTALAEGGTRTTAYGAADVKVRYFGPATNDLSSVVVRLYKTADFTGDPAAQSRLFDVDGKVELLTNNTYVVRFLGLEEGTYYALAYIDRNGDCVRQRSESWGYANQIGTGLVDIYTPAAIKIVAKSGNVPSAEIFMEDTDVNQNDIPDCLDDESLLTAASAAAGADTTDVDGDGLTADDEMGETYTSASLWDTDGDGMPDGWEAMFAGTDPLTADAETVLNGDVMAYVEETWKLVTDAAGVKHLLNPTNETVHVGDDLPLSRLVSAYDYPVLKDGSYVHCYGVGTNLTDEVTLFRVDKVEDVTAVFVHAQVYEKYGYSPLTAVPVDGAVNTKPFTTIDKYLLVRYFEALGLCTEADVNANRRWAEFSLKPNDPDNDRDGVLDGWELYVMFGPEGATDTIADAKVSPFNYDDARATAPAAGSSLTLIEEWDDGNTPTDPWQTTTKDLVGIPDAIAYLYKIKSKADLLADFDNDGLSNYTEYLLSEVFDLGVKFSPFDAHSVNMYDTDYFFKIGQLYAGEIFTDHDMMEDNWESARTPGYVSRYAWDAKSDNDEDRWSAFAECRYNTFVASMLGENISHLLGDTELRDHPIPTLSLTLRYNQSQPLTASSSGSGSGSGSSGSSSSGSSSGSSADGNTLAPIVVQTYTAKGAQDLGVVPDATFKIRPGETVDRHYYLGAWGNRVVRGNLTPGYVVSDDPDFQVEVAHVPRSDSYTWLFDDQLMSGTYTEYIYAYNMYGPSRVVLQTRNDGVKWEPIGTGDEISVFREAESLEGYICYNGNRIGTINTQTGAFSLDLGTFADGSQVASNNTAYAFKEAVFRFAYKAKVPVMQQNKLTIYLGAANKGAVREGRNRVVAFYDLDDNGTYTPGEPLGFDSNVDVGWYGGSAEMELTDTSPVITRAALLSSGGGSSSSEGGSGASTDRILMWGNENGDSTNLVIGALSGGKYQRFRVYRTLIGFADDVENNKPGWSIMSLAITNRCIVDKTLELDQRSFFYEGDVLENNELDLDWSNFYTEVMGNGNVTARGGDPLFAVYRIVLGEGDASIDSTNNLFEISTVRHFDANNARLAPVPVAPGAQSAVVFGARPVFKWTMNRNKTYTAFRVQVTKVGSSTVVYDSGLRRAPATDLDGVYTFVPDAYAGDQLEAIGDYQWRVSMFNSKFKTAKYSDYSQFKMNTPTNSPEYGSINVCAKYFGPANVLSDGTVYVEAFTTPDFTGAPVARTKVANKASVSAANVEHEANATLIGLPKGTYYVRAFIDFGSTYGADRKRNTYESWGYVCPRNGESEYMFSPTAIVIGDKLGEGEVFTCYIEDVDTNGNCLPDAWEIVKNGGTLDAGTEDLNATLNSGVVINKALSGNLQNLEGNGLASVGLAAYTLSVVKNAGVAALMLEADTSSAPTYNAAIAQSGENATMTVDEVKFTLISAADGSLSVEASGNAELVAPSGKRLLAANIYEQPKTLTGKIYTSADLTNWEVATQASGECVKDGVVTVTVENGKFTIGGVNLDAYAGKEKRFFKIVMD